MAVTRQQPIGFRLGGAGVLLALAAVIAVLPPVPAPADPPRADPPPEMMQMMQDLSDGTIDSEAEGQAEEFGLEAAGDTCLMRRGRLALRVDQDLRRKMAAARFSDDADLSRRLLADLTQKQPDVLAWRAYLGLAQLDLATGAPAQAQEALTLAATLPEVPETCRSDEARLQALIDSDAAGTLLDRAVALDPGNLAAHVDRAVLGARGQDGNCMADARRVVESLVFISKLSERRTQLDRLASRAEALEAAHPGARALLIGLVQERLGLTAKAAQTYTQGAVSLNPSDPCDATFLAGLTERLAEIDSGL